MAMIICASCNDEVTQNPKLKGRQQKYCGKAKCQRARRAAWKKEKMRTCPDFKANQALSNRSWSASHPNYWRQYRLANPAKADRNRFLQHLRNQRLTRSPPLSHCKGRHVKTQINQLVGQFWLVPVIAKVDALKVNIAAIHTR